MRLVDGDDADRGRPAGGVRVVGRLRRRGPGNLPAGVRPDSRHGVDLRVRDTAELDLPLAGAGRVRGADDGRATPRFRFEEVCATPAFPQDTRNSAVAGRVTVDNPRVSGSCGPEVVHWRGDTATRRPECDIGVRHRRGGAARLPTGWRRRVAVDHHSTSRTGCPR